ncbi:hypothetical protein [Micromonospora sp. NPDC005324]|uniref:hypothetical protein n=1 Tax=Micromonospora sp. NPDC005324 TaxID=3157033 RepID=UPI0033A34BE8
MNENPTNETPAGELQRRDHVLLTNRPHVYRVEQAHRYTDHDKDGDAVEKVLLVVTRIGDTVPQGERLWANEPVRVATDDEVAEASAVALRAEVVAGLKKLAGLIEEHKPQLKVWPGLGMNVQLADGEVSRLAAALGLELLDGYGASKSKRATWQSTQSDLGEGLSVYFEGMPAPEPVEAQADELPADEVEQVWVFTFGSGQEHDGRYVLIYGTRAEARAEMVLHFGNRWCDQYASTKAAGVNEFGLTQLAKTEWPAAAEQEHRHSGGTAGGPGENSVTCECGASFSGFDSQADAMVLLNGHIADEQSGR